MLVEKQKEMMKIAFHSSSGGTKKGWIVCNCFNGCYGYWFIQASTDVKIVHRLA